MLNLPLKNRYFYYPSYLTAQETERHAHRINGWTGKTEFNWQK